jgi:hypothetical protein
LHPDLASPTAGRTVSRFRALCGAFPVTLLARNLGRHLDGYSFAADGSFKIELKLIAKIGAAENLASATPTAAEYIAEDITEDITKPFSTKATPSTSGRAFQPFMAESIVGRAFIRVAQRFVRFFRFLEIFLGRRVISIAIRMVLHRKTAIRLLDVIT